MSRMEDYIAVYPSQDDPLIQAKIAAKKEFIDFNAKPREKVPIRGEKYTHQEHFRRLMRLLRVIFKIDSVGSGKSCSIIGVAEDDKANPSEMRHFYVLEKGASTRHDFRYQIVCRCTKEGVYETEEIKRATDAKTRATNITNAIKSWYTVTTYAKFGGEIDKMSDAAIKEQFSHRGLVCDEAHILRNSKGEGEENKRDDDETNTRSMRRSSATKEKISLTKTYWNIWKVAHLADPIKLMAFSATPNINNVGDFIPNTNLLLPRERQLPYHVADKTPRSKNEPTDIPAAKFRYDYRFVTVKQMEPFLRGLFSFARNLDTGVDVQHVGVKLEKKTQIQNLDIDAPSDDLITPNGDGTYTYHHQKLDGVKKITFESQIIVYPVKMSPYQSRIFQNVEKSGMYKGIQTKHHASEFVFPDGSFGGNLPRFVSQKKAISDFGSKPSGIVAYVTSERAGEYKANDELKAVLRDPDLLYKHSCKFYEILQIEESNPNSKAFIFTDAVTGAGAILLALMFEEHGYERYERGESAFRVEQIEGSKKSKRVVSISPGKRYAVLSNDSAEGRIASMMELFNSPENAHGEYIKIMIGSPVSRDGVNFYDVVRGYLLRAGWHPSGDLQAMSRFLRAVSHETLIAEIRKENLKNKITDEVRIPVKIYRMCSYTHEDVIKEDIESKKTPTAKKNKVVVKKSTIKEGMTKKGFVVPLGETTKFVSRNNGYFHYPVNECISVDIFLYIKGEIKDFYNRRMMAICKRLAIDAINHIERNILPTDKPGSADADYQKSPFIPWSFDPNNKNRVDWGYDPKNPKPIPDKMPIDYETYDVLYADKEIATICETIVARLVEKGFLSIRNIFAEWVATGVYRERLIWAALDTLISDRNEITDRFGFTAYVSTDKEYIFLQNEFPFHNSTSTSDLMYYSNIIVGVNSTPITRVLDEILAPQQETLIKRILGVEGALEEKDIKFIESCLNKLTLSYRAQLIERILLVYMETDELFQEDEDEAPPMRSKTPRIKIRKEASSQDEDSASLPLRKPVRRISIAASPPSKSSTHDSEELKPLTPLRNKVLYQYPVTNGRNESEKPDASTSDSEEETATVVVTPKVRRPKVVKKETKESSEEEEEKPITPKIKISVKTDKTVSSKPKTDVATPKIKALVRPRKTSLLEEEEDEATPKIKPGKKERKDSVEEETPKTKKGRQGSVKEEPKTPSSVKPRATSPESEQPRKKVTSSIKINVKGVAKKKTASAKKESGINPEVINYLMKKFFFYIYTDVLEPLADINETAKIMAKKGVKPLKGNRKLETGAVYRGRAQTRYAHLNGVPYRKKELIEDPSDVMKIDRVYLHTLYSGESGLVSYNTTAKFRNVVGKIRILKPSEQLGWRDVSVYEEGVYRALIKEEMQDRLADFEKHKIYGVIHADNLFRIMDRTKQKQGSKSDGRVSSKGDICTHKGKTDIVLLLLNENIMTESVMKTNTGMTTRSQMISYLISRSFLSSDKKDFEKFSLDELIFITKWYYSENKRPYMCDTLRERFQDMKRVLITN